MNRIELEAARRLLFYSIPEAARWVGDCNVKTWRRWESGELSVPEDVATEMLILLEWRDQTMDEMVNIIEQKDGDEPVVYWYPSIDKWTDRGEEEKFWRPRQSALAAAWAQAWPGAELILAPSKRGLRRDKEGKGGV